MESVISASGWILAAIFALLWILTRIDARDRVADAVAEYRAAIVFAIGNVQETRRAAFLRAVIRRDHAYVAAQFPRWPGFRDAHMAANVWGAE